LEILIVIGLKIREWSLYISIYLYGFDY